MDESYRDPDQPGAPQPGDLVVVVQEWASRPTGVLVGRTVLVDNVTPGRSLPWGVRLGLGRYSSVDYAHSIRRPTEAELAAWATQAAGGDQ